MSRDSLAISPLSFRSSHINYCFKRLQNSLCQFYIARLINETTRNIFRQTHKGRRVIHLDGREEDFRQCRQDLEREFASKEVEVIGYYVHVFPTISAKREKESFGSLTFFRPTLDYIDLIAQILLTLGVVPNYRQVVSPRNSLSS